MSIDLPNGLLDQGPMLCSPSSVVADTPAEVLQRLGREAHWAYQVKYDGIRAIVYVVDGEVLILNRRGSDITFRYPEIVDDLAGLGTNVVLDGEIVVFDSTGLPDFSAIHWRDAQSRATVSRAMAAARPATLVAFDCLYRDGQDLRRSQLSLRLAAMAGLTSARLQQAVLTGNGEDLWNRVTHLGLEGVVAKDLRSTYRGRRDRAWVKLKATKTATVIVLGYVPGEGSREGTIGALSMGVWAEDPGGEVRYVGKVGSGFTQRDLDALWPRLGGVLLVEVEYLGVTEQGHLRQPVYRGIRDDITITEATARQLR